MSFRLWILPLSAASVATLTGYDRFVRPHVYTFEYTYSGGSNKGNGRFWTRGTLTPHIVEGLEREMNGVTITKIKRVD